MAAEDPIQPISADQPPRVPPLPDVEPGRVDRSSASTTSAPPTQELADALDRSLLVDGGGVPDEPPAVQARASVHDAAMHGDAYARAIEEANHEADAAANALQHDPSSIGQVLGGAAAAAHSGQAARIDRTRAPRDERTEHAEDPTSPLDVLAPLDRSSNDDESARQRRGRGERERALDEPSNGR